jgi:hypothetical protein
MILSQLSPGQERIRHIVAEYLPAYMATNPNSQSAFKIIKKVRQEFALDPLIISDPITGVDLRRTFFSDSYLEWLKANSHARTFQNRSVKVELTNFIYSRRASKENLPRYEGGVADGFGSPKWRTTFKALFSLAANNEIANSQMDVAYFTHSKILTVEGGGNHRLLAHVLWGEPTIKAEYFHEYTETVEPDLELNRIFTSLDNLLMRHGIVFKLDAYRDAEPIKEFFRKSTNSERKTIADFIAHMNNHPSYRIEGAELDGSWLLQRLFELRRVSGLRGLQLSLLEKLGHVEQHSQFQYWYRVLRHL